MAGALADRQECLSYFMQGSLTNSAGRGVQEGAAGACCGGGWLAAVVYECCAASCLWLSLKCREVCGCD